MRARKVAGAPAIDLGAFKNPWTGLAAMILVQAANDLDALGDLDSRIMQWELVTRVELTKFFRSKWAWHLATSCGLAEEEIRKRGVLKWQG